MYKYKKIKRQETCFAAVQVDMKNYSYQFLIMEIFTNLFYSIFSSKRRNNLFRMADSSFLFWDLS